MHDRLTGLGHNESTNTCRKPKSTQKQSTCPKPKAQHGMLHKHHKLNAQSAGFSSPKRNHACMHFMHAQIQMGEKITRNLWKNGSQQYSAGNTGTTYPVLKLFLRKQCIGLEGYYAIMQPTTSRLKAPVTDQL